MADSFLYKRSTAQQYFLSFVSVAIVAALGYGISGFVDYRVVAFMLLVTVSILAMIYQIAPVLFAAVLSALIWDYFFIPPRFTFSVGTTEDRLLLLMYFIIAMVNAVLTYKIRQTEKKVRQQEERANAVKFYNTLLNSLSHELRTPITSIIGASDNLQSGNENLSEENRKELVNEIAIASGRLNEQVENLLNMSRIEAGIIKPKKDWTDINEMIHAALNRIQEDHHKIELTLADNLPLFHLDFGLMEQVVYNLVKNATLYTPDDSTITIKARCGKELATAPTGLEELKNKLVITIADNGNGFPKGETERVFEKFYRLQGARPGGAGLGLSIVKGFVELMKGKIRLENIQGGGARFTIEIPAETSYINALKNE